MADGTVLRAPSIVALFNLDHGQFDLNLFVKNPRWNDCLGVDDRPLYVQREEVLRVDRLGDDWASDELVLQHGFAAPQALEVFQ